MLITKKKVPQNIPNATANSISFGFDENGNPFSKDENGVIKEIGGGGEVVLTQEINENSLSTDIASAQAVRHFVQDEISIAPKNGGFTMYSDRDNVYSGNFGLQRMALDGDILYIVGGQGLVEFDTLTRTVLRVYSEKACLGVVYDDTYIYVTFTSIFGGVNIASSSIGRIRRDTFQLDGEIIIEGNPNQMLLHEGFLYTGLESAPGGIYKIDLSNFTISASVSSTVLSLRKMIIDGEFLYILSRASTGGGIRKYNLATLEFISVVYSSTNSNDMVKLGRSFFVVNVTGNTFVRHNIDTGVNLSLSISGNPAGVCSDGKSLYVCTTTSGLLYAVDPLTMLLRGQHTYTNISSPNMMLYTKGKIYTCSTNNTVPGALGTTPSL